MWRVLFLPLLLAGCASSGVYEVSPGTYSVTSSAVTSLGGVGAAKGSAYKQAQATRAKQGKRMEPVSQSSEGTFASGSADVTFRCI